ncbi:rutD [Symbiodinium microadriaticum]|nr:rutD [Symbiodinium sp. KB8]CAE7889327.1 rutD [Symbiodinium microadriaticum]
MGNGTSTSAGDKVPLSSMRCRSESQVPRCFRNVKCPYTPASTADGAYGVVNYSLIGPKDGQVVVCFHGLNGSRLLFQDTALYLSRYGGFRVLTFDLYGHGLSNAPPVDLCPGRSCSSACKPGCFSCSGTRARYDLEFFVEQTVDLLENIGLGSVRVNLLGFSLGGAIAMAFARYHPARVARIVAISPSGFIPRVPRLYHVLRACWCCLIPLAPHCLCTCWYQKERFARSVRSENQGMADESVHNLWSRFVWQLFVKRGVASATLATCQRVNWFDLSALFRDVGRHSRPVLLVWGERDTLNPPSTIGKKVAAFFANAKLLVIPRAGHIAICDKPAEVVPTILGFLQLPDDVRLDNVPSLRPAGASTANVRWKPTADESASLMRASPEARSDQMPVPIVLGHGEDEENGARGSTLTL